MLRYSGRGFVLILFLTQALIGRTQIIEGVFLERYHIAPPVEPGDSPLVTYRIYLDLAPDHILQHLYGDERNTLTLRTSTTFFNDTANGAVFGERIKAELVNTYPSALDSWFGLGFCSSRHKAVPKHLDPDGSILTCPPYNDGSFNEAPGSNAISLCESDGMVEAERIPEAVSLYLTTGYLDNIRGGLIEGSNMAWGVLGGVKGATPENMILIAQLTTDGELTYVLNAQVRTPAGEVFRCTARPTENAEERYYPVLRNDQGH
jgi:hypothetical protein